MKKLTICMVAANILTQANRPMSAQAIYDSIVERKLYNFKAKNPLGILKSELRKHSEGVNLPIKTKQKYFRILTDGSFQVLDKRSY